MREDLATFLWLGLTGALLAFCFDWYRVFRRRSRPRSVIAGIADLIFWLFSAIVVFLVLVWNNGGELRFYIFISLLGGVLAYYQFLSRQAVKGIEQSLRLFQFLWQKLLKLVYFLLIGPCLFLVRKSLAPFYGFTKLAQQGRRRWKKFFNKQDCNKL
ncbi:MAG: spore cortex biosynthesis protein YabQ [Sporomusaceae bacterium]|nr:spore cortex biosynthesis protein YabQ [Sporomusaceae bacterium]